MWYKDQVSSRVVVLWPATNLANLYGLSFREAW